jgi:tetratricopeptide (TPR) repeat protein
LPIRNKNRINSASLLEGQIHHPRWCLYEQGNLDAAVICYRIALEQSSSSIAQFNLGLALLHLGDIDEARAAYINGIYIFGQNEAELIGVLADLEELVDQGIQVVAAKEILAEISKLRQIDYEHK